MTKGTLKGDNKLNRLFHSNNKLFLFLQLKITLVDWTTWTSSPWEYLKIKIVLMKSNSRKKFTNYLYNKILHQFKIHLLQNKTSKNRFYRYRDKLKLNKGRIKIAKHSCSRIKHRCSFSSRSRNRLISCSNRGNNRGLLLTKLNNSINRKTNGN